MTSPHKTWRRRAATRPSPVLRSEFGVDHKARRALWGVAWALLFRPTHRLMHGWRRALLRAFGASVGAGARIDPSARIWAPWNLSLGAASTIGPRVDLYSVAPIRIGENAIVSQNAHLCAAGHDVDAPDFRLTPAPIVIGDYAWVAADAFVAPGVRLGEGAVAGARACVTRSVPDWTIVAGNPARVLRRREPRISARNQSLSIGNGGSTTISTKASA